MRNFLPSGVTFFTILMYAQPNVVVVKQPDGQLEIGTRVVSRETVERYFQATEARECQESCIDYCDKCASLALGCGPSVFALAACFSLTPAMIGSATVTSSGALAACVLCKKYHRKPLILKLCELCA